MLYYWLCYSGHKIIQQFFVILSTEKFKRIVSMKHTVTILIIDQNRYFSEGLRHALIQYFRDRKINVDITCTGNEVQKISADIIFMAKDLGRQPWHSYKYLQPSRKYLFLIKERHQTQPGNSRLFKKNSGIIIHKLSLESILNLFGLAMFKYEKYQSILDGGGGALEPPVLTHRECEIMQCLRFGMSNEAIGRQLNISAKTVSSHKCAAMRKLNFTNHIELNYWLLNDGLNDINNGNSYQPLRTQPEPYLSLC